MDAEKLLEDIENEFEVYLQKDDKPSLKIIQYLKQKYGYSTVEAKNVAKEGRLLYKYLTQEQVTEITNELSELDAVCVVKQTGKDYLAEYCPQKAAEYLSDNNSEINLSQYYTAQGGGILYDLDGTTYYFLIEDNNMSKTCRRYLIEQGQIQI